MIMKKLILLTLMIAALASFKISSSTRHITGTVFASDDKQPIPGATIQIKGTRIGTQADAKGAYAIDIADGQRLVFSFIGYQTKTVKPGKSDKLDVYLD